MVEHVVVLMASPIQQKEETKRVLAIFSHADDELGCAGTMANHVDAGHDVHLAFLTKGENSTTVQGNNDQTVVTRKSHTDKISELLGVKIHLLDFPDSRIEYTMENGYKVAELIKQIQPHIIISWSEFTSMGAGHPDHRNTSKLVWDAINYARYQSPGSKFEPYRSPINLYRYYNSESSNGKAIQLVDVSDQEEKIIKFIEIYEEAYGDWPVREFKFSSLRYWGHQSRVKLAEVFEVTVRSPVIPKLLQ